MQSEQDPSPDVESDWGCGPEVTTTEPELSPPPPDSPLFSLHGDFDDFDGDGDAAAAKAAYGNGDAATGFTLALDNFGWWCRHDDFLQ